MSNNNHKDRTSNQTLNRHSLKENKRQKVFLEEERHQKRLDRNALDKEIVVDWRMKQRLKTVHVALVMCMNIGVDPPDVIKVHPCAKLECWIDPFSLPHQKALETIGAALKSQYERWQPRARYKQCLDPTVEDVKKTCCSLRRSAKKERILFHYNGHGVPRPTTNGEIWVFNKNFTQYIPLSFWDLYMWMDSPSIYVFDCNNAGLILKTFTQIIQQKEKEEDKKSNLSSNAGGKHHENILLASCAANESLPLNPNFPADLFTACLTTPIKIALQWFCQNNRLVDGISASMIDNLPGRINDRRTPLGELNWIFTAVTDTIAWSVLPRDLFHKLFRQDLLVASLFRNFLLADRILRAANCTPMSYPKLPQTHDHPMWQAWDLAVDMCLAQLPTLISNPNAEYKYSTFFSSQLTDFQVWLDFGNRLKHPPKQLPILLQVLLSQVHRLRALTLLGRFLDMGSWAVNLALSVGIFPYVLKLLQSNSVELREILVFIWAKILALDRLCQVDLVKDNGHIYFINILDSRSNNHKIRSMACFVLTVIVDKFAPGQRACLNINGNNNLLEICVRQLAVEHDPLLRRWLLLLISKLIEGLFEAQHHALSSNAHEKVSRLLADEVPEVRAAAVYCLASFVSLPASNVVTTLDTGGESQSASQQPVTQPQEKTDQRITCEMATGAALFKAILDGSPLVRRELVYALGVFLKNFGEHVSPDLLKQMVDEHMQRFTVLDGRSAPVAQQGVPPSTLDSINSSCNPNKRKKRASKGYEQGSNVSNSTTNKLPRDAKDRECGKISFFTLDLCRIILLLSDDPMPSVSNAAQSIVNYLRRTYLNSDGGILSTSVSSTTLSSSSSNLNLSASFQVLDLKSRVQQRDDSIRRSRSPMRVILPSANNPPNKRLAITGSSRFFKKSVSEPDFSAIGDNSATLPSDPNAYEEDGSCIPESRFYEWSCEYFSRPMLPENKDDDEFDHVMYEEEPLEEVPMLTPSMSQHLLQLQQEEEEEQDQLQQLQQSDDNNSVNGSARDGMTMLNSPRRNNHAQFLSPSALKRQRRNEQLIREANTMIKVVGKRKLEEQIGFFGNESDIVREMRFHPFEPYLIVADESDGVTVWNWVKGSKTNSFHVSTGSGPHAHPRGTNHNSVCIPSRITDFQILNEQSENSLLLVSSASGNLHLYKHYERPDEQYLVSAIRAEPDAVAMQQGPGILTEWQQDHGLLYVSGDIPHIKIWDMERELCIQTVPTDIEACVTSLACDHVGGFGLVAGCSDGSVLIYDRRQKSHHALVSRMREHKNWVVNVCIQKVNTSQVISGSASGDIKFWDTRIEGTLLKSFDAHKGGMTTLAVHDYAPVMACGSNDQFIKVFNTSGETLSMIYYHDGFLGQRIGPVSSLTFHPYRMCLAAGSTDSIISIYSGDTSLVQKGNPKR